MNNKKGRPFDTLENIKRNPYIYVKYDSNEKQYYITSRRFLDNYNSISKKDISLKLPWIKNYLKNNKNKNNFLYGDNNAFLFKNDYILINYLNPPDNLISDTCLPISSGINNNNTNNNNNNKLKSILKSYKKINFNIEEDKIEEDKLEEDKINYNTIELNKLYKLIDLYEINYIIYGLRIAINSLRTNKLNILNPIFQLIKYKLPLKNNKYKLSEDMEIDINGNIITNNKIFLNNIINDKLIIPFNKELKVIKSCLESAIKKYNINFKI